MARATDIVGYTYKADLYCPKCILAVMWNGSTVERAKYESQDAEDSLEVVADALGIDRDDESSFDSGKFPKVVRRSMLRQDIVSYVTHTSSGPLFHPHHAGSFEPDRCGSCGEVLGV